MSSDRLYAFGPFRLDAGKRLLWRGDEPVLLTPKLIDTLLALVENGGRGVSKDELMRRVWGDSIVEEGGLARNVSMLRKALGESPTEHQYIVTIPGEGYRFVARVKELQAEAFAPAQMQTVAVNNEEVLAAAEARHAITSALVHHRGLTFLLACAALIGLALLLSYLWPKRSQPLAPVKSVAVLPFKPLVGESRDEALQLGMTDTLITKLSSVRQVVVRPTSAVRKYADPAQDPVTAGKELMVESVLDGTIQKAGDQVRITVRLVRVSDGMPLWSGKFDEKFTDILAVQDSISARVAEALALRLTGHERSLLTKRHTGNAEAYRAYVMGRYFWNKRTIESLEKSVEYFRQAIDLDPSYAQAYAALADSYAVFGVYNVLPPKEAAPKAKAAAMKAVELDDTVAEAHASLAVAHVAEGDGAGAEREFRRAIQLNPNYATARQWYSECLTAMGRHDDAIAEMKRALEIDPLSLIINAGLGQSFHAAGRPEPALEQLRKTLEMDQNFYVAHVFLGQVYEQVAKTSEAIAEYRKARLLTDHPWVLANLGHALAVTGRKGEARRLLGELKRRAKQRYTSPTYIGVIYGGLADTDQAFMWLERAYEKRDPELVAFVRLNPQFRYLHSDPRFVDLMRRVGLPQ
jgi:DNA-binding winged helix-turn-helix (wHTH) protein/TolB-like protein/tetratricopeptide (TPR) repeat protein